MGIRHWLNPNRSNREQMIQSTEAVNISKTDYSILFSPRNLINQREIVAR